MKREAAHVCPFCGGTYRRTYEEHTGDQRHRHAVYVATRTHEGKHSERKP